MGGLAIHLLRTAALVALLTVGGSTEALAASPEGAPAFSYELYCDAQGRFTYDGAALQLVKQPSHLERVYADAGRGDARAKELVRELEHEFHQVGVVVADTTTRPACLPLPELTPECRPNWQFLREFLGDAPEAQRLRQVVAHAYEERARQRGLQNKVIVAGVNLLLAGGLAKGLITQAAAAEAQGAAGKALATEATAVPAEATAASRSGLTAGGAAGTERLGKSFTRAGKREVKSDNAAAHGGQATCTNCGKATVPAQQSKRGVTPPGNETHVDHIIPKSKGGNGSPDNGQVLCRDCNLQKGAD